MRLSTKILVTCILAGIIPTIIVAVAIFFATSSVYLDMTNHTLSSSKNSVAHTIAASTKELAIIGDSLSNNLAAVLEGQDQGAASEFQNRARLLLTGGNMDYIALYGPGGQVVYAEAGPGAGEGFKPPAPSGQAEGAAKPAQTVPGKIDIKYEGVAKGANGAALGTLVVGSFLFTDSFVDQLKEMLGVAFTVFCGDTRSATTIVNQTGQRAVGTKMANPAVVEAVLQKGGEFQDKNNILGQDYDTVYWPIKDGGDKVIGMYFLGIPTTMVDNAKRNAIVISALAILAMTAIIVLVSSLLCRRLNKSLNDALERLLHVSGLIGHAAGQVHSSSDELGRGVSTQASAVEETSASMEEINSMIKQNSDHSDETNAENHQVGRLISEGAGLVKEMGGAMSEISESAGQIGAIIKTIESIAFQTNLLALNASVEAARAGEAGAGFAVVAEEVRNLAQRSTQAAGDTNSLITGTVTRVENGVRISGLISERFGAIETGSTKVGRLLDQIDEATKEQATGVAQVNQALLEMSKVATANSQSADTTAAAAKEMADAIGEMNDVMDDLTILVTGHGRAA